MFNPNEKADMDQRRVSPPPERPLPKPLEDPRTQLWVPNKLDDEPNLPKVSTKQHVKHLGNFIVPIIGVCLIIGVFAYAAILLIGVYK